MQDSKIQEMIKADAIKKIRTLIGFYKPENNLA